LKEVVGSRVLAWLNPRGDLAAGRIPEGHVAMLVYVVAVRPELLALAFQTNRFEGMGHTTEQASRGSLERLGLPLIFLFIDDAQLFATNSSGTVHISNSWTVYTER